MEDKEHPNNQDEQTEKERQEQENIASNKRMAQTGLKGVATAAGAYFGGATGAKIGSKAADAINNTPVGDTLTDAAGKVGNEANKMSPTGDTNQKFINAAANSGALDLADKGIDAAANETGGPSSNKPENAQIQNGNNQSNQSDITNKSTPTDNQLGNGLKDKKNPNKKNSNSNDSEPSNVSNRNPSKKLPNKKRFSKHSNGEDDDPKENDKSKPKSKLIKHKDKSEWIKIENSHEAIIDEETFNKVQVAMKERTKPVKSTGIVHLFSGKVFCLECEHYMRKKNSAKHEYLVCSNNRDGYDDCINKASIRYDLLADLVLEAINKKIKKFYDKEKLITRYLGIIFAFIQGYILTIVYMKGMSSLDILKTTVVMTAGTCFLLWLGDQVTTKGIGNGISLLIMAGIIQSMPSMFVTTFQSLVTSGSYSTVVGSLLFALFVMVYILIILGVVFIQLAERRVPIQYSNRTNSAYGAQTSYLPIKLNAAGVMPVIFASTLITIPTTIVN